MKPKILVSAKVKTEYYVDAVNASGGDGHAEYCPSPLADHDGLVICGGSDIDPKYYGESLNGAVNMDNERDESEFALVKAFYEAGKPIMGICRGMQLLNIFFGGSLYQHIDSADIHIAHDGVDSVHGVSSREGGFIEKLYGKDFSVNSAHHQAVNMLGDGLLVTATANGIIEAVEHKSLPIIGVQWHPERMCCTQKRADTVDGLKIFEYFIKICRSR